jgi:hypothetical protein
MSVTDALVRISEIQSLLNPGSAAPAPASTSTATAMSNITPSTFASLLTAQGGSTGLPAGTSALMATPTSSILGAPAGTTGQRMVQIAQAELGQAEQPPGSNDSPRIAEYRTATAGSGVGPWCAYFTSWVARQAGVPLGEAGQGFGAVASVADWAQRTGRFIRRVRRLRRLDHHDRGQLLQRRLAAHLRAGRRRRDRLRARRLTTGHHPVARAPPDRGAAQSQA